VPVREVFGGQTVWRGEVEVFDLNMHPNAKRCYTWIDNEGEEDEEERLFSLLEIPPVESAATAVRVSILVDAQKRRNQEKK
jgi:hypothetical protein